MASHPTRLRLHSREPDVTYRCVSGKVGYPTKDRAWDAAEAMMARGQVDPGCHIHHWQCPTCGAWHIGNKVIVHV